jgi:hypothetical protein
MKNILKKLSEPVVYRRLFLSGLIIVFTGLYLESIYLMSCGIIVLVLGKVGMRIEHREKKHNGEIK